MIWLKGPALLAALLGFFATGLLWSSPPQATAQTRGDVVSIGNAVTEIVYALGQEHRLAARDSTSTYPPAAQELPDIGYMRALSAEGVLSVGPSLILATEGAGPPEVVAVLKSTGIPFVEVPSGFTADAIAAKIDVIGDALGAVAPAADLSAQVRADMAAATGEDPSTPKRVMFLISAQGGKLMAAGQDTAADAVIALSGGINAVSGFSGYKVLEDEAAFAAAPDVVLMMDRGGAHSADAQTLFALPTLSASPAARDQALVKMEGQKLLGFGPRTAEAIRELRAALHGHH